MSECTKLRAVIYCRVSTQEQTQKDALYTQVEEARGCVYENGWKLVDEYIEMESGTTKSGRAEYRRLLSDMRVTTESNRWFDIIVIKSLDRLNRCAKNWYLFVEELIQCEKRLYIYMDRIFYKTDDNLFAGIKAILAEQYSRDLSRKVNAAHAYRQKNGTTVLLNNNTYGYRKNADKTVTIMPEEAEMIRVIYQLAAQGRGAYYISNLLYEQGIRNRNGNQLGESTIRRIVHNPLFKGSVVMNRKHFDFEKKKITENPPSEWILHEGLVPAIVDETIWEQANEKMGRLSGKIPECQNKKQSKNKKILYNFSGKIVCGVCGAPYYKTFRRRGKEKKEIVTEWKCSKYLKHGRKEKYGCDNIFLGQKELETQIEEKAENYLACLDEKVLFEWVIKVSEYIFTQMEDRNKEECIEKDYFKRMLEKRKESLEKKQKRLLELVLEGVVQEDIYKAKMHELQKEESDVEKKLVKFRQDNAEKAENERKKPMPSRIKKIEKKLLSDGIRKIKAEYFLLHIQEIRAEKTGVTFVEM